MKLKGILLLFSMALISMNAWGVPLTEKSTPTDKNGDKLEIASTTSKAMSKAEVKMMKERSSSAKEIRA